MPYDLEKAAFYGFFNFVEIFPVNLMQVSFCEKTLIYDFAFDVMHRADYKIEVFATKPVSNLVLEAALVIYLNAFSYYDFPEKQLSRLNGGRVTFIIEKPESLVCWVKIHMLRKSDFPYTEFNGSFTVIVDCGFAVARKGGMDVIVHKLGLHTKTILA